MRTDEGNRCRPLLPKTENDQNINKFKLLENSNVQIHLDALNLFKYQKTGS